MLNLVRSGSSAVAAGTIARERGVVFGGHFGGWEWICRRIDNR